MNEFNQKAIKEQLMAELNLDSLSEEERQKVIDDLMEVLMERVAVAILSKVPQEEYHTIDAMLENGDMEQLVKRLKVLVPDAEEIARKVILQSIDELKTEL